MGARCLPDSRRGLPTLCPRHPTERGQPIGPWSSRGLGEDPQAILDAVLAEIRERGPLASRDFDNPEAKRGGWWNWKPAKTALEVLFARGYLLIDRRENFQRYYDLAERVLPASTETPVGTLDDWWRWATLRSVGSFGVATYQHVSQYYPRKRPAARATLERLAADEAIVPVEVEGWKHQAYMLPSDLTLLDEIQAGLHQSSLTTFLSPFDNLIWARDRVQDLFGFAYRIEMYTPAASGASTVTTCCPSCTAGGSWAGLIPRLTARRPR